MSRRSKHAGAETRATLKVCGFRLDERCDGRLREVAGRFGTTPSKYAKAVLTTHLLGDGPEPAGTPAAPALDDLGAFLHQVRDELFQEAERQGKRVDALTARVNALVANVNVLAQRVGEVDKQLADFLARVEPM